MKQVRRVPQRTCIACRSSAGKRDLIRIVRTASGSIEVDETGKKAGRGAYLCEKRDCWDLALKKDRLAAALRTGLTNEDRQRLRLFAASLPQPPEADSAAPETAAV